MDFISPFSQFFDVSSRIKLAHQIEQLKNTQQDNNNYNGKHLMFYDTLTYIYMHMTRVVASSSLLKQSNADNVKYSNITIWILCGRE